MRGGKLGNPHGMAWRIDGARLGRCVVAVAIAAMLATAAWGAAPGAGALPFPNSRMAHVGGVELHLRDWWPAGAASAGCPVLLVHALAGSTFSFRHLAPALAARGHRVLAIDLPGYGYSERRPFEGSAAAALWALASREAPGQRWCLGGHSMGARVVGQMVAEAPHRVAAAAYLSGSPIRERRRNPSMFRAQPLRGMVLAMAERRYLRRDGLAEALAEGLGHPPTDEVVDAYLAPLRRPGTLSAILDGYARDMGPDRTAPAQLAAVPTVVVWGDRDRWLRRTVGERLAASLPGARWVAVADAGHSPMETHPDAVLAPLAEAFAAAIAVEGVARAPAALSPAAALTSPP